MQLAQRLTAALLVLCSIFTEPAQAAHFSRSKDAVPLSKIQALTFRKGDLTTHRRVDPLPQLNCVGGSAQGFYEPDVVRCVNQGSSFSAEDIEWTCTASLPPEFKLGSTDVICEGYNGPDDTHVLKGSCGLEYRLVLTDAGEKKYAAHWSWPTGKKLESVTDELGRTSTSETIVNFIFWAIFLGVVGAILYSAFSSRRGDQARPPRPGFGGGYDDGDDPPPPYDPQPPRSYSRKSAAASQSQGWRPGFWSGAAAGTAAGYFAGQRSGRNGQSRTQQQPSSTGGWFGGGDAGEGSSRGSRGGGGSSSGGGGGFSSERHESTGFGGTRRR